MSVAEKDRVFPIKPKAISDAELAQIVSFALRQDFGDTTSAVKRIGKLTNANLRAIKNWYEGRNTPSSGHLLLLARSSPSILKFMLEQVGGEDLWDAFQLLSRKSNDNIHPASQPNPRENDEKHTGNFVSINVVIDPSIAVQLNERQLWFMGQLQQNQRVKADNIAASWKINQRTAWRDVGALVDMKLIRFQGARKTGCYCLVKR